MSLHAILDADKEGFLRGKTALIQTIGRAARNTNGKVPMYADKITEAIRAPRRDEPPAPVQLAYNEEHGSPYRSRRACPIAEFLSLKRRTSPPSPAGLAPGRGMSMEEIEKLAITLEEEMFAAAEELRFEYAAKADEIMTAARARPGGGPA